MPVRCVAFAFKPYINVGVRNDGVRDRYAMSSRFAEPPRAAELNGMDVVLAGKSRLDVLPVCSGWLRETVSLSGSDFYRAMLCMRGTSHGPVSVCLSVSVKVGVLLKWLNVGSNKQHHTIAQGLQFSGAKDLREIRPGSPTTMTPNAWGWVKIGDFRQITGYISKTVKDRHIVSIKVE